jgi:uncharacterized Zn finger protein (UPF0148 family)
MTSDKIASEVLKYFVETYNTQTLCPNCGGLIEKQNEINCKNCSTKQHIKTNTEIAQTALMRIKQQVGN